MFEKFYFCEFPPVGPLCVYTALEKNFQWTEGMKFLQINRCDNVIDLLPSQQKSLDRALFLCIFKREVRSSGVRASIIIVRIRKFYKM